MTTNIYPDIKFLKTFLSLYYEGKTLRCAKTWKQDLKCSCGKEKYSFKNVVVSEDSNIFLCSDNLCEYGENIGLTKISEFDYFFWYDDKEYLFYYIKLPDISHVQTKYNKDVRDEWDRIYDLCIKEKEDISKQQKELTLKMAKKYIEEKKIEVFEMEEIFRYSFINEKLNNKILEFETGIIIDIKFEIETKFFSMKLCNEYISEYDDFLFKSCVFLPLSKNMKYEYSYAETNKPYMEKIVLNIQMDKSKVGK